MSKGKYHLFTEEVRMPRVPPQPCVQKVTFDWLVLLDSSMSNLLSKGVPKLR